SVPAHVGLAKVQELAGDRDGASKTWESAAAKLPNEPSIWYERGMYLGRRKDFVQATTSLERAARLDPRNMEYSKSVGFMLARQGRDDDALPWLLRAMPEADAHYNLARMMQHVGREDAGQRHLELALRSKPEHEASQKMLAERTEPETPRET